MKHTAAAFGTILVLAIMAWLGIRSGRDVQVAPPALPPASSPGGLAGADDLRPASARVERLLSDAARGDVPAYLAAFSGPIAERMNRRASERGAAAFADDLRRAATARKGHAVFEPEPDGDRPGVARVTVESTFADRVERQMFRLVRQDEKWLVDDVETARVLKPPHAPGSPATFQEPEGIPVPAGLTTTEQDDAVQEP